MQDFREADGRERRAKVGASGYVETGSVVWSWWKRRLMGRKAAGSGSTEAVGRMEGVKGGVAGVSEYTGLVC